MPNFFLHGKSWDIVGMGFSKVPKVLGDERLVPNPLGVNEWRSDKMDSFFPEGITLMASTVLVNCLPLAHECQLKLALSY
jgi:hypothetical protein